MKPLAFFLALTISLFITSCSDENSNNIPVSPQHEIVKPNVEGSESNFRYDYMTTFNALDVKSWGVNQNSIDVTLRELPRSVEQVFCEIDYIVGKELVFLEKPEEAIFSIPYAGIGNIDNFRGIKIFALQVRDGGAVSSSETPDDAQYPYPYMQNFGSLAVERWSSHHNDIQIVAEAWSPVLEEVWAVVHMKTGDKLLYLQKPASESFTIEDQGGRHLQDLSLYGY